MASGPWNVRPGGRSQSESPFQPIFYIPDVDSNDRCDRGPPSTLPTGVLQPTPPMSESSSRPPPSSNQLILQNQHSQPPGPKPVIHDKNSYSAAQSCGTAYLPSPSPMSWVDPLAPRKKTRVIGACDNCRSLKIKCNVDTPCAVCLSKGIECKRSSDLLQKVKSVELAEIKDLQEKIYDAVSDLRAKFDRKQSAGSHNSPVPAHSSTEHSFCSSNGSTHRSPKAIDSHSDSEKGSAPPPTPTTDIPTTSSGDEVDQELLATMCDEAEWNSDTLRFYIGKYYETTTFSNGIIPRGQLDGMIEKFLIDRECLAERSNADIDVAIFSLALAIGKLYAKGPGFPVHLSDRLGQAVEAHGFTYFKRGKDIFNKCSSNDLVHKARANALLGLYLYLLSMFPASLRYLSAASQSARDLVLSEIRQFHGRWLYNKLSTEDINIIVLHISCLSLESDVSQTMWLRSGASGASGASGV